MQSTHAFRVLPVVIVLAAPLVAQTRVRIASAGEWFYHAAAGRRLAQLEVGAVLEQGAAQGEWIEATLDGWIFAASVGPSAVRGFDLQVTRAPSENLRAAPDSTVLARLTVGFGLSRVEARGRWVHVRRRGWVRRAAVAPVPASSSASGGLTPGRRPGVTADSGAGVPVDVARVQAARATALYRAPDTMQDARLAANAPLRVLGRSGDWTRVALEGWVKTDDLRSAPPGVLVGVSAAEVRAEPDRYVGQTLRWTVQAISLRPADDLRPDIPEGARYLLARGPLPERGFVYVVVPEAKRAAVEALGPLATVQITARVRVGRGRYLGNPVVDLIALEVQP
jgi:hypothetical protein